MCPHTHIHISWLIFAKIGTDVKTCINKNEFVWGQPYTTILGQEVLKIYTNINNPVDIFKCTQITKISVFYKKLGLRNMMVMSDFRKEI